MDINIIEYLLRKNLISNDKNINFDALVTKLYNEKKTTVAKDNTINQINNNSLANYLNSERRNNPEVTLNDVLSARENR
jgi:hypothetical protein